jgi:hypothetical protein
MNDKNIGSIVTTNRRERIGNHYRTVVESVTWDAPLAYVDCRLLDTFPSSFGLYEVGPYIAKVVGFEPGYGITIIAKVDHPLATLYPVWLPLRSVWQWFTTRFVYTLAVWGLANYPRDGCYIGWYLIKERWFE